MTSPADKPSNANTQAPVSGTDEHGARAMTEREERSSPNRVLDQIDPRWISQTIAGSFSQMYLTLLSIIQGVALAEWASKSIPRDAAGWEALLTADGLGDVAFRLTTLATLVVVWHAYFWLAAIARWTPAIWDSFLVFGIGAAEFVAVINIGQRAWFYAFAALGALGSAAYLYHGSRLEQHDYVGGFREMWYHVREYKEKRAWRLLAMSLGLLGITVGLHLTASGPMPDWLVVYPAIAVGYMVYDHRKRRIQTLDILDRALGRRSEDSPASAPESA